DGEIREVIMEDEFLLACAACIGVELLGVLARAKRAKRDGLSFATLEQRGTMRTRQNPDLAGNSTDSLKIAAIQALAFIHCQAPHSLLLSIIKCVLENQFGYLFFAKLFDELLADFVRKHRNRRFTGQFARREQRGDNALTCQCLG